jgi:dipeptidyl aminopeptidase/acylaminoacyl peptidase
VPSIAFQQGDKGEVFLVGIDGSGPERLLDARYVQGFTQSPAGSRMVYWSDEEVPNETFTYVANADGTNPKKIAERWVDVAGWASEDSLIMEIAGSRPSLTTLVLHDIQSGQENTLLVDIERWAVSPDGQSILFVSGPHYTPQPPAGAERLEVLDIETGQRRPFGDSLADGSYSYLQWSSNGRRVAYLVGPPHFQPVEKSANVYYDLHVREVAGGEAKFVYRIEGQPFVINWSATSRWFLIELRSASGCTPEEQERAAMARDAARARGEAFDDPCPQRRALVLVDAENGQAQEVVNSDQDPAATSGWPALWSPSEGSFAYATSEAVYLQSAAAGERRVAIAPGTWPFAWSPDGRFILFWRADEANAEGNAARASIAVIDTDTGETRTLVEGGGDLGSPRWWR